MISKSDEKSRINQRVHEAAVIIRCRVDRCYLRSLIEFLSMKLSDNASQCEAQALILAGGKGTRLYPLTATTPKPLISVMGIPMVEHQLAALYDCGVHSIVLSISTNHTEQFRACTRDWQVKYPHLNVKLHTEEQELGTGGAIIACVHSSHIDARCPLIITNADCLCEYPFRDLMHMFTERRKAKKTVGLIATTTVDNPHGYGKVVCGEDGRITNFCEKPLLSPSQKAPTTINMGLYIFDPRVFLKLRQKDGCSFERDIIPALLQKKNCLGVLSYSGFWCDMGTFIGLQHAKEFLASQTAEQRASDGIPRGICRHVALRAFE